MNNFGNDPKLHIMRSKEHLIFELTETRKPYQNRNHAQKPSPKQR
jgi:hypothetical protein